MISPVLHRRTYADNANATPSQFSESITRIGNTNKNMPEALIKRTNSFSDLNEGQSNLEKFRGTTLSNDIIKTYIDPRPTTGMVNGRLSDEVRTGVIGEMTQSFVEPEKFTLSREACNYLKNSRSGNAFSGLVQIHTGTIFLYPLAPTKSSSAYDIVPYKKNTHDKLEPIVHVSSRATGDTTKTSHTQMIEKFAKYDESREDFIGFTFKDTRGVADQEQDHVIYGRSATLNTDKYRIANKKNAEDELFSYGTEKETHERNKIHTSPTYDMPAQHKKKILESMIKIDGISQGLLTHLQEQINNPEYGNSLSMPQPQPRRFFV